MAVITVREMARGEEKTYFALSGETVDLLEASACDPALEDAKILFCVHIKRFVVNGLIILGGEEGMLKIGMVAVKGKLIGGGEQFHRATTIGRHWLKSVTKLVTRHTNMDSSALHSKLKLLKVVDLRAILAKTDIVLPQKANKADLIAKIQASKPAIDVYHALYPSDDLLAPPEEFVPVIF